MALGGRFSGGCRNWRRGDEHFGSRAPISTRRLLGYPYSPDRRKKPAGKWKAFQEQAASEDIVTKWYRNNSFGIALIGGEVSGNLEVIDVDEPSLVADFEDAVEREIPGLLDKLTTIQTPRDERARQYLYRCEYPPDGNTQLAMSELRPQFNDDGTPRLDPDTGEHVHKPEAMIETRGEGGYVVTVGSPGACHPTGREYQHINGPPLDQITHRSALPQAGCVPANDRDRFDVKLRLWKNQVSQGTSGGH